MLPDGSVTRYWYDVAGALVGVEHDGHKVAIQRDVLGREIRKHVYQGQVDIQSAYDAMDRLVDQRVMAPAPGGAGALTTLAQRRWAYDPNGRVRAIADARWGSSVYRHDAIGQLVEARRGALHEVFEYDVTGSLQNALSDLAAVDRTTPWRIEPGNLLVETPDAVYENDAQGRRTKRIHKATSEVTEYYWDCRDRLREVRDRDGRRIRYTYDAFGRRVRKEIIPAARRDQEAMVRLALEKGKDALPRIEVTEFLWDGDAVAAELAGDSKRVFVHEPGTLVPLLQAEQGEVFTYVNDHLGMPKELIGQDGRVAWAAAHSAWGKVVEEWRDPARRGPVVESPFRLLGQWLDRETGLCYTRFRYFDPEVGRWVSPDPIGLFGSPNLTSFDGSPIAEADPDGLAPIRARQYLILPHGGQPSPRSPFQSHHIIQNEWAKQNIEGYSSSNAFAVLLTREEHAKITTAQNARRDQRTARGKGKWSSSIREEFENAYSDLERAGVPAEVVQRAMKKAYKFFFEGQAGNSTCG